LKQIHEVNYFKPTRFTRGITNIVYVTTDLLEYVLSVMQLIS